MCTITPFKLLLVVSFLSPQSHLPSDAQMVYTSVCLSWCWVSEALSTQGDSVALELGVPWGDLFILSVPTNTMVALSPRPQGTGHSILLAHIEAGGSGPSPRIL